MPLGKIGEIIDPLYIMPEKQADMVVLTRDFNIPELRRKHDKLSRKIKKWFK
jgi:hypothetical protein